MPAPLAIPDPPTVGGDSTARYSLARWRWGQRRGVLPATAARDSCPPKKRSRGRLARLCVIARSLVDDASYVFDQRQIRSSTYCWPDVDLAILERQNPRARAVWYKGPGCSEWDGKQVWSARQFRLQRFSGGCGASNRRANQRLFGFMAPKTGKCSSIKGRLATSSSSRRGRFYGLKGSHFHCG